MAAPFQRWDANITGCPLLSRTDRRGFRRAHAPGRHHQRRRAVPLPVRVSVQVFVLFPPLEHAPDQMTSRLFVALSVIVVPAANDAEISRRLAVGRLPPSGADVGALRRERPTCA